MGTSSVKVLQVFADKTIVKAKAEYEEIRPEGWWKGICHALSQLDLSEVKGIGLSSQVGTYIINDTDVISWSDGAGAEELAWVKEHYDTETIYENIQYDMNKIPITYFYQTFREYNLVTKEYTDEELLGRAEQEFNEYILNLEEKSIQILEKSVNIQVYGESAVATGTIIMLQPAYTTVTPEIEIQKEAENR